MEYSIAASEYKEWLAELKRRYQSARLKASIKVNSQLLQFYWSIGKDIVSKKAESTWGSGFYKQLSGDLTSAIPNVKGFSPTNLKYMKYFYELFQKDAANRPQLVDDLTAISWGHIRHIIDSCKNDSKKALFFVQKTIQNGWSRSVLLNFLDTDLYERDGKAISNFAAALPAVRSDLAQQMTKDPYCFDFIAVSEKYSEKELKNALIQNIEKFLLELGKGFAYMGREFRLEIGSDRHF